MGPPPERRKAMAERSDALKKAQQKYMERFAVARIRMERGKYEAVQEYAEKRGKSVNALVVDLLDQTISCTTAGAAPEAAGGPQGARVVSLPSKTIEAAQQAAKAAGETVPVFIDRAIEETADRDALSCRMKGGENHVGKGTFEPD